MSARFVLLADDQSSALVALAEHALRQPDGSIEIASDAETPNRVGWSLNRFNRKIDDMCVEYSRAGVLGLRGTVDGLGICSRPCLVGHGVDSGALSVGGLRLLGRTDAGEAHRPGRCA